MIELLSEHESKLVEKLIENVIKEKSNIVVNSKIVKGQGILEKPFSVSERFLDMYLEKIRIEIAKAIMISSPTKLPEEQK